MKLYVEKENDFIGLEEIETELKIQTNKRKIKLNKHKKRELLSYEYNDHKILVGRNNKENDEITFSKGQFSDIWLHIKNLPGSHVLIIKGNSKINKLPFPKVLSTRTVPLCDSVTDLT